MNRSPRVVVLLSEVNGPGGIQRYNRTLCRSLNEYRMHSRVALEVLSLHDRPFWRDAEVLDAPFTGCESNRALFVERALRALAHPYALVIVGHVDLGQIAVWPHSIHRRHGAHMMSIIHGMDVWSRLPLPKRVGLRAADLIWSCSAYTRTEAVRLQGAPADRIAVVPNALDPSFPSLIAESHRRVPVRSRLLTVSRLARQSPGKGVDNLITALPSVLEKVPDANLTVVGDGDDMRRLRRLAADEGVDDAVTFAGLLPDSELHRRLAGTDVFVLPSRREGFGIVFLEAMAHGRPVIGGAHGGTPEVVVDGVTGTLVTYGDQAGLIESIVALLNDGERRASFGAAGAERVSALFSYERFRDTVFQTMARLL